MSNKINEIYEVSFKILAEVGLAKSLYIEGFREYKRNNIELAQSMYKDAKEAYVRAHEYHKGLVVKESREQDPYVALLLVHAEDQFSSVELISYFIEELSLLYEKLDKKD